MDKISRVLKSTCNLPIKACFTAKIFGGTEDAFSKQQQELVLKVLKNIGIIYKKEVSQGAQITFDARNGEATLETNENKRLEHLQRREYGDWNDVLDRNYGHLPESQIPYFEIKEAARLEANIPNFSMKSTEHAQKLERMGKLMLPIQAERAVVQSRKDAIAKLQKLITPSTPEEMKNSIETENFEFLLRYASKDPKHIKLLGFLLDNRSTLGINIASQGEKSGTAIDVAKKFENQPAIDLLAMYQ